MSNILVIAELHDGHVRKSTHSAINFARQAASPFSILILGQGAKAAAETLEPKATARSRASNSSAAWRSPEIVV